MTNHEYNIPQSPDSITSLGVNNKGEVVIITKGTDGSYNEESFADTSFPLNRVQGIFLEQQKVYGLFSDYEPEHSHVEDTSATPLDLDEIRRQIQIAHDGLDQSKEQ